jgi:hypothetical protein
MTMIHTFTATRGACNQNNNQHTLVSWESPLVRRGCAMTSPMQIMLRTSPMQIMLKASDLRSKAPQPASVKEVSDCQEKTQEGGRGACSRQSTACPPCSDDKEMYPRQRNVLLYHLPPRVLTTLQYLPPPIPPATTYYPFQP